MMQLIIFIIIDFSFCYIQISIKLILSSNGIECALIIPGNEDAEQLFIIQNSTSTLENAKFLPKGDIILIKVDESSLFNLIDNFL